VPLVNRTFILLGKDSVKALFYALQSTTTVVLTLPQAELAAQLLEEEWPDEDEVRAARMAVREEATPVPERAWALRNVASTLALGGLGERARARNLLEKAVTLKELWLDDDQHPGDQDSLGHRQCNVSQKHSDAVGTW
jgi:hypothetical protein